MSISRPPVCIPRECFDDLSVKNAMINMFKENNIMKKDCINILLCRYYTRTNTDDSIKKKIKDNNGTIIEYYYDYIMGIYNEASKPSSSISSNHTITLTHAYSTNKIMNKNFGGDYSDIEFVGDPNNNKVVLDVTQIDKNYIYVIQISSDDINYDVSNLFKTNPTTTTTTTPTTTTPPTTTQKDSIYFKDGQLTIECPFKFESLKQEPNDNNSLISILKKVATHGKNGVGDYMLIDTHLEEVANTELKITNFYKAYIEKPPVNAVLTEKLKPLITQLFTTKVLGYFDPNNTCNAGYNNNVILKHNYEMIKDALKKIQPYLAQNQRTGTDTKNIPKYSTVDIIDKLKKKYKVDDNIEIPTAENTSQEVVDFLNLFDKNFEDYVFTDRIPIGLIKKQLSSTYFSSSKVGNYVVFLITGDKLKGKFSIYGNREVVERGSPPNVATRYLKMEDNYDDKDVFNRINEKIVTFQKKKVDNNFKYTNAEKSNLLEDIKDAVNTKIRPIKLDALVSYDFHSFKLLNELSLEFDAIQNMLFDVNGFRPVSVYGGRITRRKSKSSFKKSQKKKTLNPLL